MASVFQSKANSSSQHQQDPSKAVRQTLPLNEECNAETSSLRTLMASSPQQQSLKAIAQMMANSPVQQRLHTSKQFLANKDEPLHDNADIPLQLRAYATVQRNKVVKSEESNKSIADIVDLMQPRAVGAAADMLFDFKELEEDYRYFVATNELDGEDERFGLMSVKTPPEVQGPAPDAKNPEIDSSLWVEGLVADAGSGLGALLLNTVEEIARQEQKLAVAMAAYEYDPKDRGEEGAPYSIAGYYEKKGYHYTGEAYEEVDDESQSSYFYPIYSKPIAQLKARQQPQPALTALPEQRYSSVPKTHQSSNTLDSNALLSRQSIATKITQLRSEQIVQRQFAWSKIGADGVLLGDDEQQVIKIAGYDAMAVPLDQLAAQFGFSVTNARIVKQGEGEWETVIRAVKEGGGWSREADAAPQTQALVMDKLTGVALHETFDSLSAQDPQNPTAIELLKIIRMCNDLGKMLVLDLITRNNDRFNLVKFDNEVLSTDAEKQKNGEGWRTWMGNEGNILIDDATGAATPVDSQYTDASNEQQYVQNMALLLVNKKDSLVTEGMSFLQHNWADQEYAKAAFKDGINIGIERLLSL